MPLGKIGGVGVCNEVGKLPAVVGDALVSRFQAWAQDEGVFDELFDTLRRALHAKTSIRVPSNDERGFTHEVVDDWPNQIQAANSLARILRLMPQAAGTVINTGPHQTLNISAGERLAELDAIGVPREELAKACQDLLEVARTEPKKVSPASTT